MTSDFDKRYDPKSTGSTQSLGYPADVGAGDMRGSTTGTSSPSSDEARAKNVLDRETSAAKAELGSAAEQVKQGAADLAATARDKAYEGAEKGKEGITSSLGDFAAAVRKASDELGERDQSMAAGLVRQVATGLEQASGSIEGQSIQDLTRSVAAFARRQPTTFLVGAALVGVALGRFARASSDHVSTPSGGSDFDRRDDDRSSYRGTESRGGFGTGTSGAYTPGRSSTPVAPPVSAGTVAPRPSAPTGASGSTPGATPIVTTTSGFSSTHPTTGATPASATTGATPAPVEGPSGAVLGHGSGSFNPQGGRDVR